MTTEQINMPAKILVIDDEPQLERLILQRFRRKIKNKEYEFIFAQDGVEALEKLEQERDIDIVLSDINMPKMDGLTFIARLNEFSSLLKAIMVSAYGDMENIRTAMNRGAYDFVTKPIDFEDLEVTINKALKEVEILKLAALALEELSHIQQELNVASEIQQSILPKNFAVFPEDSNFEICAKMIPAKEIGGDFYDFFLIDDRRLGFVIGDVSGKGMPAALFMAISRTLIKATALKGESTSDCMKQVNYLLSQDNPKSMFVTLIYGILNFQTGELEYSNGGHNLPCLIHANGQVKFLEKSGNMALGIVEDFAYRCQKITLEPGTSLALYTDGITEAMDKNHNEFSDERLQAYLQTSAHSSSKEIIKGMIEEVKKFTDGAPQSDDMTTMVIKCHD